jgi:hypothetical protein
VRLNGTTVLMISKNHPFHSLTFSFHANNLSYKKHSRI